MSVPRMIANFFLHLWGTIAHKAWIMIYVVGFCADLLWRGIVHDLSKLSPTEFRGFIKTIHRLKASTYGSDEYKELLDIIKPSLENHYSRHRHHPEHYDCNAFDLGRMSLVDIVEMWIDWRSAVRRHDTGNIGRSLAINENRFKIPMGVANVLHNSMSAKDQLAYKDHYMRNRGKLHHWGPPCAQGHLFRTGPMPIQSGLEVPSRPSSNPYSKLWRGDGK